MLVLGFLDQGTVYLRASEVTAKFTKDWHTKIATSDIEWMRDQPSFNLMMRDAYNTTSGQKLTDPLGMFRVLPEHFPHLGLAEVPEIPRGWKWGGEDWPPGTVQSTITP